MKKFANLHASRFANLNKSLQVLHAAAALEFEFVCKLRIRIFLDRKICNVCKFARIIPAVRTSAVQENLQRSQVVVVGIWVGEG